MKNFTKKILSAALSAALVLPGAAVFAAAEDTVDYKITNPYESVTELLGNTENHYKTNLHTHSTLSDAETDYADMIKAYYEENFDILGFADHGVLGRYWNDKQVHLPLYLYQYIIGNKTTALTDEEYEQITSGTFPFSEESGRTNGRGMKCVPQGIELNMLTMTKSHVNGYFCNWGENDIGFENGFEYAVSHVDKAGGISVINHPGDWLESSSHPEEAKDIKNVRYFGDIFLKYNTCLGMEVLNGGDSVTRADRVLWDELLRYVIPNGRTVLGFANSDAHNPSEIDTCFMDFIIPEFSLDNVKNTMMTGNFFAIGRRARYELGDGFKGTGPYPTVTSITVDDENDIITVTGINAYKIQWIADGNIIEESTEINDGVITSTIKLREHSDEITCYARFQLLGDGGICIANPFVLDDGDMARFIIEDTRTDAQIALDNFVFALKSSRFYVIFQELIRLIARKLR